MIPHQQCCDCPTNTAGVPSHKVGCWAAEKAVVYVAPMFCPMCGGPATSTPPANPRTGLTKWAHVAPDLDATIRARVEALTEQQIDEIDDETVAAGNRSTNGEAYDLTEAAVGFRVALARALGLAALEGASPE